MFVRRQLVLLVLSVMALSVFTLQCKRQDESPTPTTSPDEVQAEEQEEGQESEEPPPPSYARRADEPQPEAAGEVTLADLSIATVQSPWHTFRGNNQRTGLSTAPAIETPVIDWRVDIGIFGYPNTLLPVGERLFVSTQGSEHNAEDNRDGVVALDAASGEILWRYRTEIDAGGMTYDDGTLFVVTDMGSLHAIDADSGDARWVYDMECPSYMAPLVLDDLLVMRAGFPHLFFRENGNPETTMEECQAAERGGLSADGNFVVASSSRGRPQAFRDGALLWTGEEPEHAGPNNGAWHAPLLTDGLVIQAYQYWPFTDADESTWDRRPAVVAYDRESGGIAYIIDLLGYDANRRNLSSTGYMPASPLLAGQRLFVPDTESASIKVYNALNGQPAGRIALPDCRRRQFSSPVGTATRGYLARHDGVLYAFDYAATSPAWSLALGRHDLSGQTRTHDPQEGDGCTVSPVDSTALFATPSIGNDGTLYVGSGEGWVYAIRDRSWPERSAASRGEEEAQQVDDAGSQTP